MEALEMMGITRHVLKRCTRINNSQINLQLVGLSVPSQYWPYGWQNVSLLNHFGIDFINDAEIREVNGTYTTALYSPDISS